MARVTRAASHLSAEEVKRRLKHDSRPWCRQRWLIIYNALIEPRKAEEIAKHCGVSKAMVHQVISTYNRLGVEAVETAGRGGRRHEYLSVEEEKQFLAPFFARAQSGEIATATEELIIPSNIRLIQQPAYGPEVNPVEHLWEELREKYFHNRLFSSLDFLTDELCRGLNELTDDKERLSSMMSFPHLKVFV